MLITGQLLVVCRLFLANNRSLLVNRLGPAVLALKYNRFLSGQVRVKGIPENWGSKKAAQRAKISKKNETTGDFIMAEDGNFEDILAPLRAAVKEQVTFLKLTSNS